MSVGNARYNSGKKYIIAQGTPVPTPIALDPAEWEGSLVYADDADMYFSDGEDWVIISDAPIRRPTALFPTTAEQLRQLRLSAFLVGSGYSFTQTGVIFRVALNPEMTDPILTEIIPTTTGNSYTLPADFLPSGTTFWWQGKYTATGNQESQFSKTVSQVMPSLINTPIPITPVNATSLTLSVRPFESAFGYQFGSTIWELYTNPTGSGTPFLTATNAAYVFRFPEYVPTVIPGATYYWRAKFRNTTVIESNWSALRAVTMDQSFSVRDTLNVSYFVGRSVPDSLQTPYLVSNTVLNSNGTPFVCP